MKVDKGTVVGVEMVVVELTRRNLEMLLAKLDDEHSARTIIDSEHLLAVKAVEDSEHYKSRQPGPMLVEGQIR